jgi:hypothetical protein
MKAPYHLILLTFFITTYSFGQIDSFPPEAEMKLITLIEHEKFTFRLDKFEKEGVPNLSMSKGKEFIRVGADLPTILKEVWPKQIFEIHPGLLDDNYHLMIQHLDQEATDEFFAMILEEWIKEDGLDMQKKHKNLKVNCVHLSDLTKLSEVRYQPEEGVVKAVTRKSDEITLKGYTLQEVLGIISHESAEIFLVEQNDDNFSAHTYEVSINLMNLSTIRQSLGNYGFIISKCLRPLEVIYME